MSQNDSEFGENCCPNGDSDYEGNCCFCLCRCCDSHDCFPCCRIKKYNHCVRCLLTTVCCTWLIVFILVLCVPSMGVLMFYDQLPVTYDDTVLLRPLDTRSYESVWVGQINQPLVVYKFLSTPPLNATPVIRVMSQTIGPLNFRESYAALAVHVTPGSQINISMPGDDFKLDIAESAVTGVVDLRLRRPVVGCPSSSLSYTYTATADVYVHFCFVCCQSSCQSSSSNVQIETKLYSYQLTGAAGTYSSQNSKGSYSVAGYSAVNVPLDYDEPDTVAVVTPSPGNSYSAPPVSYYDESDDPTRSYTQADGFVWRMNVRDELWWPLCVFFAALVTAGSVGACVLMRKRCQRKRPFMPPGRRWNAAVVAPAPYYGYEMREVAPRVPLPVYPQPVILPPSLMPAQGPPVGFSGFDKQGGSSFPGHDGAPPPDFGTYASKGADSSSGDNGVLCVVCMERRREVLLLPCHHICLCGPCASEPHTNATCPICRTPVQMREHVFLA